MDDEYSFQRQALPVAPLPPNFDPDAHPETGEQYLQLVLYERTKRCADIVHVSVPKTKLPCKSIINVFKNDENEVPLEQKKSTVEWQQIQLQNFSSLREKITILKNNSVGKIEPFELPDIEEMDKWKNFCQNNQPLLKIIISIRIRDIEILLEYLAIWLKEELGSKSWITLWIYGCLSCLFTPLEPNSCSVLREIAKTSRNLRDREETENEQNISYSLLICLISTYFRQLDLSDTFN